MHDLPFEIFGHLKHLAFARRARACVCGRLPSRAPVVLVRARATEAPWTWMKESQTSHLLFA